jgi:YVTN family beta-propeller protein
MLQSLPRRATSLAFALIAAAGIAACGDEEGNPVVTDEAIGPQGELVYVGNVGTVSIVDAEFGKVVATVDVGAETSDLNTNPGGSYVFANLRDANAVAAIETATQRLAKILPVGPSPVHNFLAPDGVYLWVRNDAGASASVINTSTLEVEATVPTGVGHGKVAFNDGTPYKAYVSNIAESSVSVCDGSLLTHLVDVTIGAGPHGMCYSGVSQGVYNCTAVDVAVVGPGDTVVNNIAMTNRCGYIVTAPDGRHLWATVGGPDTDNIDGTVVIIDSQTDQIVGEVECGRQPDKVAFSEVLDLAVVSNVKSAEMSLVRMSTLTKVADVPVDGLGAGHRNIRVSIDGRFAFTTSAVNGTLSIVNLESRQLVATVPCGDASSSMVVVADGVGQPYPH